MPAVLPESGEVFTFFPVVVAFGGPGSVEGAGGWGVGGVRGS